MVRTNKITVRFSDSEYNALLELTGDVPLATYIRNYIINNSDGHSRGRMDRVTVTKTTPIPASKNVMTKGIRTSTGLWIEVKD